MDNSGIRLFGMWCPILGGSPPFTTLHIFDHPFEEDDNDVKRVCSYLGEVKNVKKQKYIFDPNIFTGTQLVSVALSSSPPASSLLVVTSVECGIKVSLWCVIFVLYRGIRLRTALTKISVVVVGPLSILPVIV